ARRFESRLRPTVPARSVAPITAMERGVNSASNPGRFGGDEIFNLSTSPGREEFVTWLTKVLLRTRIEIFFHNRSEPAICTLQHAIDPDWALQTSQKSGVS